MPLVLKLSSQRQLTLPKAVVEHMGTPSYFEAVLVNKELVLRPAQKLTLDEAQARYGKHGITVEVLREALRIVEGKEKREG